MKRLVAILAMLAMLASSVPVYASQNEGATPSGIPFSQLGNELDNLIIQHIGIAAPGVAVVVVHDGEIVFSQGWGYANSTERIPVDPATTVFEYASVSKLFIWVSAMQLVEQGLLDLDADIAVYLPQDFMRQMNWEFPVTMRDLMNHTAGFEMPAFYSGESDATTVEQAGILRDALTRIRPRQIFEPGTVSAYSNFGTSLAAYVISHITGQGFADFERENVFMPAGMVNTLNQPHWVGNQNFLSNKAIGYVPSPLNPGVFADTMWSYVPDYPSGAVNGTAEDLARFAIALTPPAGEAGALFESAESLARMFTPSSLNPISFPGTYHGFMSYRSSVQAFGHAGLLGGFTTDFAIAPKERFGVAVLVNAGGAFDLTTSVLALLLGETEFEYMPTPANLPNATAVEGWFAMGRSMQDANGLLSFIANELFVMTNSVTAIDENTIEFDTLLFGSAIYRQTAPYVFEIVSSDAGVMNLLLHTLRFEMYDGYPVRIHIGSGMDFIYVSEVDVITQIMVLILAVICILFFLAAPIFVLISFLKNRNKGIEQTNFRRLSRWFLLACSALSLHTVIVIARFFIGAGELSRAGMSPHIWVNFLLAAITAALFAASMIFRYKERKALTRRRKILFATTWNLWLVLMFAMFNWNFFMPL